MPTSTFYRLPATKQERILEALKAEIARSPYESFSIGAVLHSCGISRGSFYQYFHNKEEIYLYFLADYQKEMLRYAVEELKRTDGNLFDALDQSFRYAVRMLCYKDSKSFRHNLFCNLRLYELLWQSGVFIEESRKEIQDFLDQIDISTLRVNDREELHLLVDICLLTALKDCAGIFMADNPEAVVIDHFSNKLALLRRGFQIGADGGAGR